MKQKNNKVKIYSNYTKKYWYCFLFGPIFMILEACGEFLLPYLNANIINVGATNKDISFIIQNGLLMILIALGMLIAGVLGANFAIRGSTRLATGVRNDAFKKIQEYSFSNIDDFSSGSLVTRLTNDTSQIQNFTQALLRGMFRSPVMLIGAIFMAFKLDTSIALTILMIVPLLAIAITIIIFSTAPKYSKMQQQLDVLNTNIDETITNERVIKSFVREDFEQKKFEKVNDDLKKKSTSALKSMLLMRPALILAIDVTTLLVVWFAGKKVMVGSMEVGTLTAFITYISQILNALNLLANIVLQGTRAVASHKRISEIFNATIPIDDSNVSNSDVKIESGKIEFKNVSFKYFKHNKFNILENINLTIEDGEFVGIIGSTGSGKSTFVSMIPRLYDPDFGEVFVDGKNVKQIPLKLLRENVSMVLQKNTLFSGTIAENLCWGKENASLEEMEQVCKFSCADGFISTYPDKYEHFLEQGGTNLSGGQKQRLCIARALLKNPKILILDDSTSAVDTATDAKIRKYLREDLTNMTKIIIAQRIGSVLDADKILVLDNGKIVGFGKHNELIESCQTYQEIYWSQIDKNKDLKNNCEEEK